jgi:hypothetical protein
VERRVLEFPLAAILAWTVAVPAFAGKALAEVLGGSVPAGLAYATASLLLVVAAVWHIRATWEQRRLRRAGSPRRDVHVDGQERP